MDKIVFESIDFAFPLPIQRCFQNIQKHILSKIVVKLHNTNENYFVFLWKNHFLTAIFVRDITLNPF